jgi:hypothetical protein
VLSFLNLWIRAVTRANQNQYLSNPHNPCWHSNNNHKSQGEVIHRKNICQNIKLKIKRNKENHQKDREDIFPVDFVVNTKARKRKFHSFLGKFKNWQLSLMFGSLD